MRVGGDSRHSGGSCDDALRRSFLRLIAALVGTSPTDRDALGQALASSSRIDAQFVDDLTRLTCALVDRVSTAPDPELAAALRGHLAILDQMARGASPIFAARLRAQADRVALALTLLDSILH